MTTKSDSVEQKCYLDYLVSKYVTEIRENKETTKSQYNTAETIIHARPIVMQTREQIAYGVKIFNYVEALDFVMRSGASLLIWGCYS